MRMKSQGLRKLFFGVAEGAAPRSRVRFGGTAIAQRSEARASGLYGRSCCAGSVSWCRGTRQQRGSVECLGVG